MANSPCFFFFLRGHFSRSPFPSFPWLQPPLSLPSFESELIPLCPGQCGWLSVLSPKLGAYLVLVLFSDQVGHDLNEVRRLAPMNNALLDTSTSPLLVPTRCDPVFSFIGHYVHHVPIE